MTEIRKIDFKHLYKLKERSDAVLIQTDDIIILDNEYQTDKNLLHLHNMPPFFVDAKIYSLIISGEIALNLNYKTYRLKKGIFLRLNGRQVIRNILPADNYYKAYSLIFSHEFFMSIIKWVPELTDLAIGEDYYTPLMTLEQNEIQKYINIIEQLKRSIKATGHCFHSQIVKMDAAKFVLELSNCFATKHSNKDVNPYHVNHAEESLRQFLFLVLKHCRQQREVSFYANKMNMTPGNLSRVITKASGKPPVKWIAEAITSEAKIVLRSPDKNIQQVAQELNFGDQSSFGKFFKKHTGLTPIAYKNSVKQIEMF